MHQLQQSVVPKHELGHKAMLASFMSAYILTLTYGHELWLMIEEIKSRMQGTEMLFVRRVAGLWLLGKVCSSDVHEELQVQGRCQ